MLWHRSLVMIDVETRSLWSHILGQAKQGPLEGAQLETLPSLMTDWKTWSETYPDSTVAKMSRTAQQFRSQTYGRPERFMVGMLVGDGVRGWAYDQLERQSVVNDQIADLPLLVTYLADSGTAAIFDRRVGDQTLTFRSDGNAMVDDQTGSTWELATGRAISGDLQGQRMTRQVGVVSFRSAWDTFHPDTEYWEAE